MSNSVLVFSGILFHSESHFAISALRAPLNGDAAALPRVPAVHVGEGRERAVPEVPGADAAAVQEKTAFQNGELDIGYFP